MIHQVDMGVDSSAPTVRAQHSCHSRWLSLTLGGYPRGSNFADRTPKGKENFRKYHASAINVPGQISLFLF